MRSLPALARFVLLAALRGVRASASTVAVAVFTIALALVLAGASGIVIRNMQLLVERVGDELTLSVYPREDLDDADRSALAAEVARVEGVQAVEAVSREAALARFPERTGVSAAAVELLDENPLPASLEVRLRPQDRSLAAVERIRVSLQALPGVIEVSAGDDWIAGYDRAIGFVRTTAFAVGIVLGLATLVIVASTIRLALQSRRDELEILELVGASRSTLRLPFLLEGLGQGAVAGLLAWLLLRGLFALAKPSVEAALAFLVGPGAVSFLSGPQVAGLVLGGALLGVVGAALSLAADTGA